MVIVALNLGQHGRIDGRGRRRGPAAGRGAVGRGRLLVVTPAEEGGGENGQPDGHGRHDRDPDRALLFLCLARRLQLGCSTSFSVLALTFPLRIRHGAGV
jgi:hypothetical protein